MLPLYLISVWLLGAIICYSFGKKYSYALNIFIIYTFFFIVRIYIVFLNENIRLFSLKGAGNQSIVAFEHWQHTGTLNIYDSFFVQTLIFEICIRKKPELSGLLVISIIYIIFY